MRNIPHYSVLIETTGGKRYVVLIVLAVLECNGMKWALEKRADDHLVYMFYHWAMGQDHGRSTTGNGFAEI